VQLYQQDLPASKPSRSLTSGSHFISHPKTYAIQAEQSYAAQIANKLPCNIWQQQHN
jgi:hypothetical protein